MRPSNLIGHYPDAQLVRVSIVVGDVEVLHKVEFVCVFKIHKATVEAVAEIDGVSVV